MQTEGAVQRIRGREATEEAIVGGDRVLHLMAAVFMGSDVSPGRADHLGHPRVA